MTDAEKKFIEKLYCEMAAKLLIRARASLGDRSLAEEAVQDTFRVVCENISVLTEHPNPNGWVTTTLKNILRQMAAKRAKDAAIVRKLSELADISDADDAPPNIDLLYADLTENEDYKLLKRYVAERCTIRELAHDLGLSVDVCAKRLQRARERLKKYFENS